MPQFSSDPTWDQGLSTLAQGLFPNPAGIAQGAYYGAEARRAGMQASEIQRKMQAQDALPGQLAQLFGQGGAGSYTPPPAVASALTPAPPPPGATPMPTSGAVAFPNIPLPGMTAPMPAGPGGLSNGPLASVAASTPTNDTPPPVPPQPAGPLQSVGATTSGPPPQPDGTTAPAFTPSGQPGGLSGGQINLSGLLSSYLSPGSPFMGGATPTQSPPSSVSPPAPNTTGSDGSVPHPDPSAALMHPGTLQDPGGGVKYAPPASANGAPAPPLVNLGTLMALAARTGMDPSLVKSMVGTAVESMVRSGTLDKVSADRILTAGGEVGSYLSTQSGQLTSEQGANYRAGLPIAEQAREFNITPVPGIDPNTHLPVMTTRPLIAAAAGTSAPFSPYDDQLIRQKAQPMTVMGPNGAVITTQGQAPGNAPVSPALEAVVTVLNPDGTTQQMTAGQAIQQKRQVVPKDLETFSAARAAAIAAAVQAGNTTLARQLSEATQAGLTGTTGIKPAGTAQDFEAWNGLLDQETERAYPVQPLGFWAGLTHGQNADPARLVGTARTAVLDLAQSLNRTGTPEERSSQTRAITDAFTQLQQQGKLPTTVDRSISRPHVGADPRTVVQQTKQGPANRFGINLLPPANQTPPDQTTPNQNPPQIAVPNQPQQPNVPPIAAQARSGTVISTSAPPGAREGQKVYGSNGQVGIVRGGAIVAP
jgi:hypothetical protein